MEEIILKNEMKLIISLLNDSMNIKISKNKSFHVYSKKYTLEELLKFKLFRTYRKIENIINCFKKMIKQNNYDIEENNKKINLILKSSLPDIPNIIFKLTKIYINPEEKFELLFNEIILMKEKELREIKEKNEILINNHKKLEGIIEGMNKEMKNLREEIKLNQNLMVGEKKLDNFKNEISENINKEDIKDSKNENNKNDNYINSIYNIKEEDLKNEMNILNYENNKEEIQESCNIILNNKQNQFSFKQKFDKEGEYNFYFFFNNPLSNIKCMYKDCSSLISLNFSNFKSNNVEDMSYIFQNCSSLTSLNLSNFNTNNVTNMKNMFRNCCSLTSLNLYNFNTNKVTDMRSMFYNCSSLTSLNLSNFNTINVKDMGLMFEKCSSLTSLNLSNFSSNNVNNMNNMFRNCSSLTSLDISNININNVKDINDMFYGCSSLSTLNLSNFNDNDVKNTKEILNNLNSKCIIITKNNEMLRPFKK